METVSKIKLEKYVPVRKQMKSVNQVNICKNQAANDSRNDAKPTLPEAA